MKLTITGAPRTKKTSNRIFRVKGRPVVMPSKAWTQWVETARIVDMDDTDIGRLDTVMIGYPIPRGIDVNCAAVFYRDARRGDAVGYYQGLADLLEKREVVANDAQIVSWNGSRLDVDRTNPRTEIVLEPVGVIE